jgi:hypothetical protein
MATRNYKVKFTIQISAWNHAGLFIDLTQGASLLINADTTVYATTSRAATVGVKSNQLYVHTENPSGSFTTTFEVVIPGTIGASLHGTFGRPWDIDSASLSYSFTDYPGNSGQVTSGDFSMAYPN